METKLQVRTFDSPFSVDEFKKIPKRPITVLLDNLRSAFNVGSIIRTADCALLEKVIMCGITPYPPHDKLEKTALGALPFVSCEHRTTLKEAVLEQKEKGESIIALETTNKSNLIWEYDFPLPVTLILGNEALGVSPEILEMADDIVEIPMLGFKNSINVSVAFGIVVYEIQRQYWNKTDNSSLITMKNP